VGKTYTVEPNSDRIDLLVHNDQTSNVHAAKGAAGALPSPDKMFDAVVAMWILITSMISRSPRGRWYGLWTLLRLMHVSSWCKALDNEVVNLINKACGHYYSERPPYLYY
jgi:hypothetical protein